MKTPHAMQLLILALLAQAPFAVLAEEPVPKWIEEQNPAPVNTFEIEGGRQFIFDSDEKDEYFYRLNYKGNLLKSAGTPLKYASGLDLKEPNAPGAEGDTHEFAFRLENGGGSLAGGLLEAIGTKELPLRGLEKLDLRGTAYAGADKDGDRVQLAVGLETPSFRVPLFAGTQWSNWIVLGINGQQQEDTTNETDDETFGLLTYRVFVGKSFGWRKNADVAAAAAKPVDLILGQAPTVSQAKALAVEVEKIKAGDRTTMQQLFLDAVGELEDGATDDQWKAIVQSMGRGYADAITDRPTISLYVENSGYYVATGGKEALDGRSKNLVTATLDYWFLPTSDDTFLRLRYEYGYERATPLDKKNQLLISAVLRF